MNKKKQRILTEMESESLIKILRNRFFSARHRHENVRWNEVMERLLNDPAKLWSLNEMEKTGGEPDVVGLDETTGRFVFFDCSAESPSGRRAFCYDSEALASRKSHKPENSAIGKARDMGVDLLTEEEYLKLQKLGSFDTKTSSWLFTPPEIRKLGGAIFGDCRFGRVFIFHNGAGSVYSSRGFRTSLKI